MYEFLYFRVQNSKFFRSFSNRPCKMSYLVLSIIFYILVVLAKSKKGCSFDLTKDSMGRLTKITFGIKNLTGILFLNRQPQYYANEVTEGDVEICFATDQLLLDVFFCY